jgi:hypothetical protein
MLDLKFITATVHSGVFPGEHKCQCGVRRFGDCLSDIRDLCDACVRTLHYTQSCLPSFEQRQTTRIRMTDRSTVPHDVCAERGHDLANRDFNLSW